jgi:hypothetical protein
MTSRTRPSFSMTLMRSTSISSNLGRVAGDCARNAAAARKTSASVLPPAYSFRQANLATKTR